MVDRLINVPSAEFKYRELVICDRRFGALRRFKLRQTVRKNIPRIEGAPRVFESQPTLKEFKRGRRNGTISADQVLPHTKGIHACSTFPRSPRFLTTFNDTI